MTKQEQRHKGTMVEIIKLAIESLIKQDNFERYQVVVDAIDHVCCNETCEEILSLVFEGDRDLMESFYDVRKCERCEMLDFADSMYHGYCECCTDDMGRRWL